MTRALEEAIGALALRQHGVAARAQLLDLGMTPAQLTYRVRSGRFRLLHRGVYGVSGVVLPGSAEMAAVLASGPGAVVSHRSAATLHGLLPHPGPSAPVHVTLHGRDRGRRPGLAAHRVRELPVGEVSEVRGIPVTSPARTLLDLSGEVGARELERALARADRESLIRPGEIEKVMERRPRARGIRTLRDLLGDVDRRALTRSEAEERLLELVRKARLPSPEVNVPLAGYEVDFLWRSALLVLEVDGFAYHSSRASFEKDRRRDAALSARGYRVMRITWRQIAREPEAVLARLAQAVISPSSR
jgi:very-short-patch-repair endonuclease